MPELPEVETMRRGILPIVGAKILAVERTRCRRRPISVTPPISKMNSRLQGQRIAAVERLGKRVVIRTENDDRLIFEPRMTGNVLIENPPTQEHLRFRLRLSGGNVPQVLFWDQRGLGSVYLLTDREYADQFDTGRIGPDACVISLHDFSQRLKKSRRPIKVALLDQSLVAGVGNIYASELLHRARIDPRRPCSKLSLAETKSIRLAMRKILNDAIRFEGSTLTDGIFRNALNQSGNYQDHHRVYDREGEPCPTCRQANITRIVQSQRSTFFCKKCQR